MSADIEQVLALARRIVSLEAQCTEARDAEQRARGERVDALRKRDLLAVALIDALPNDEEREANPALAQYRADTHTFRTSTHYHDDERTWDEIRKHAVERRFW